MFIALFLVSACADTLCTLLATHVPTDTTRRWAGWVSPLEKIEYGAKKQQLSSEEIVRSPRTQLGLAYQIDRANRVVNISNTEAKSMLMFSKSRSSCQ